MFSLIILMSCSFVNFSYNTGIKNPKYAISPKNTNREDLLNSHIKKFSILITPIIGVNIHKDFQHAAIVVHTNNELIILIEYGAYDASREGDYQTKVHYFKGNNGLRFVHLNESELLKIAQNRNNYYFNCDIENKNMTVCHLLLETTHCDGLYTWNQENYNLFSQNCQFFVCKAIKCIKATRNAFSFAYEFKVPKEIIMELRANERKLNKFIPSIFQCFAGISFYACAALISVSESK